MGRKKGNKKGRECRRFKKIKEDWTESEGYIKKSEGSERERVRDQGERVGDQRRMGI